MKEQEPNQLMEMFEKTVRGEIQMPSAVCIDGDIDKACRQRFCAELDMAAGLSKDGEVDVYVTSCGGSVEELMLMITEMEKVRVAFGVNVNTIAEGYAYSGGAMLVALGDHRSAQPNTMLMIHDVQLGISKGTLREHRLIDIHARKQQRIIEKKMAKRAGKTPAEIRKLWDVYLTGDEAMKAGLIDEVIVYE